MASIRKKHKDYSIRTNFCNNELNFLFSKVFINDSMLPYIIRYKYNVITSNINKNKYLVRVNNRCIITRRSQSTYKLFKFTRMAFKNLATNGLLVGVKKSSW